MKFLQAENPMEWIALKANLFPMSLIFGMGEGGTNRVFLTALRLGIFEATKDSALTVEEIAQKTGFQAKAITSVMGFLTVLGCFKYKNGRYSQTPIVKKWCLLGDPEKAQGVAEFCDLARDKWLGHLEQYLRTGKGLEMHDNMTERDWHNYQIMMEYMASLTAGSASSITPIHPNPTAMLDIGGSHGLYSVEMCKKYPSLKATILELPEAIAKAKPLLAKYNMGDRVSYWAANALTDDFGDKQYDLVLISSLMHHFTAEENIQISRKAARALKPGGYFVIQDFVKPEKPNSQNLISIYVDLLFNLQSASNTWTKDEMIGFQQQAGLGPSRVNTYRGLSDFIQVYAQKSE